MKKHLVIAFVLIMITALIGIAGVQAGMGGGQMPMGQPPKGGEDKPGEPPSQMPMNPELAARMMNACIGAMEGMAQMGRMMGGMMGGEGGTSQMPSGQKP
jgi:hypothetical protein